MTGVSFTGLPLQPKRLGLLHELLPPDAVIALLRYPKFSEYEREAQETDAAAREVARRTLGRPKPRARSMRPSTACVRRAPVRC